MNRSVVAGSLLAVLVGVLAPVAVLVASVYAAQLIDPGSRISAFLAMPPRHPVQLAVATVAVYLAVGLFAGFMLRHLARAFGVRAPWAVGAFAFAFVGSVAVAGALQMGWPPNLASSLLPHIAVLLVATAFAVSVPRIGVVRVP